MYAEILCRKYEECPEGCEVCEPSGCSECQKGWFLYTSKCLQTCPEGWEPHVSSCIPSPLHAVSVNSPVNLLTLRFSQSLASAISSNDFDLSVLSPTGLSSSPTHVLIPINANQSYNISLHFSESPPDNFTLSLHFLSPRALVTSTGQELSETTLKVLLYSYMKNGISAVSAVATAAAQGTIASVVSISLLTGNSATLFGLISHCS